MRVLVTRPARAAIRLAGALGARGHETVVAPFLEIVPTEIPLRLPVSPAALLFTSAHAVDALKEQAGIVPVFAVGAATAQAARDVGYTDIVTAGGDGTALVEEIRRHLAPEAGALLHVRGLDVATPVASRLAAEGYQVVEQILYRANEVGRFPVEAKAELVAGQLEAALFYSARTATAFKNLLTPDIQNALLELRALAFSSRVAGPLEELGFRSVEIAAEPTTDAMLALLEG